MLEENLKNKKMQQTFRVHYSAPVPGGMSDPEIRRLLSVFLCGKIKKSVQLPREKENVLSALKEM